MRTPPTVADVGVAGAVVLAICVRIELGAPARISNYMLRHGRAGKRGQQDNSAKQDHRPSHGMSPRLSLAALTAVDRKRSYSRSVEARGSAQPVIVRKDNAY